VTTNRMFKCNSTYIVASSLNEAKDIRRLYNIEDSPALVSEDSRLTLNKESHTVGYWLKRLPKGVIGNA
jgi:hypothetical protein